MDGLEQEAYVIESFLACFSEQAFAELFPVFYPRIFRYFRARRLTVEASEELSQNVLLAVFRSARQVRDPAKFRPWIFQIARNELLQHERRNRASSRAAIVEQLNENTLPAMALEVPDFGELLRDVDPLDREILYLRFVDGLTYSEIAELLNMPTGTLKWRVARARAQVASQVQPAMKEHV